MTIEEEMHREIKRLESDLVKINDEMKRLEGKMVNLINVRKKKEHDLKILKSNFGEILEEKEYKELQTTLERLLKESSL